MSYCVHRSSLLELFSRFDTLYCIGNSTVVTVSLSVLFKDYRIVSAVCTFFPSVMMIVLSDALPPKTRKATATFGMSSGVLAFMYVIAALYFNWCDVTPIVFQAGSITVSMASLATSGLINLILLFLRCLVSAIQYESSFVIIKSRMEVIPTTKELADVFMASYELVNSKAASIRIAKKDRITASKAGSRGVSSARTATETKVAGAGTGSG
jgi:hypothetical protein